MEFDVQPEDDPGLKRMNELTNSKHKSSHARRIYYCGLVCVLASIPLAIGGFASNGAPDLESMGLVTESVRQARFIKTIPAFGEVRTYSPLIIVNDCPSRERRIIELVPEGSLVEKGEIVCILDTADLTVKLDLQMVALIRAKAALTGAKISESLQDLANSRRLSTRQYRDVIANGQLNAYEQAEAATEIERLKGEFKLKEEILQIIQEEFEATRQFTALGYRNTATLLAAEAKRTNAQTALENARRNLNLATDFQQPRSLLELQSEAENARLELDRAILQNKLSKKMAELRTLEMERRLSVVQKQVEQTTQDIEACTMRAQKAGEVMYCHRRDKGRIIEVGQDAFYKQELIRISDRTRLMVATRVIDQQAHELHQNQPVEFQVQSNENLTFAGTLAWIAAMPSTPSRYQPHDRYHDVEISIDPNQEGFSSLPLGSTVVAEIFVDDRPDVIQVPVTAVFNHHGEYAVLVKTLSDLIVRAVELGANNDTSVEIINGLDPGEIVVTGKPCRNSPIWSVNSSVPSAVGHWH